MTIANTSTLILGFGIGVAIASLGCVWIIGLAARDNAKANKSREEKNERDMQLLHAYWADANKNSKQIAAAVEAISQQMGNK